jgi:dienelactone hydrolase
MQVTMRASGTTITRREAIRRLASAGPWLTAAQIGLAASFLQHGSAMAGEQPTPPLAPGTSTSLERMALIDAFRKESEGLQNKYEARTLKRDWVMPYRLLRPEAPGKLPLVVYLHGSGGQGDDNLKQLGLGNIFGTRVWLLPQNQKVFPCYVLVPQTDRGWVRYDPAKLETGVYEMVPGPGQGVQMALEVIDALRHEFAIDDQRIYVAGQSMGGAGVWNMLASRPKFFAAAVICCGSISKDDGTAAIDTPVWNFHGDSDQTVPVSIFVTASRPDERRAGTRSPLSMLASTTTSGSGPSPNRSCRSGCSRNAAANRIRWNRMPTLEQCERE